MILFYSSLDFFELGFLKCSLALCCAVCQNDVSKGVIQLAVFGIKFMFSITCAILSPSVSSSHVGSMFSTERRRFSVFIMPSTRLVPPWSPTGVRISLMWLSLQNISKFCDLNAWAWSHLIVRGIPWNFM